MLAGHTECVSELRHREAGRSFVEESPRRESSGLDRIDVEPQSVAFDEQSDARQPSEIAGRDSLGRIRRTAFLTKCLDHRMSEERIDDPRTSDPITIDHQIGHRAEYGSLTFVESTEIES